MSGGTRHLFRDGFIGIGDPMFGVASRHERASALGIFGSVIGVAAVAGQILGGHHHFSASWPGGKRCCAGSARGWRIPRMGRRRTSAER